MKTVIMGCGRVGARLAEMLDAEGNQVTILDNNAYSFKRFLHSFNGTALVGNGTNQEVLKKAGIGEADIFITLTGGDNRNIMAAQIAKHIFNVPRVICRIKDPLRQEMYATLGLETICPTTIFANMLKDKMEN
ncbi:MAG: TrkA family potassium uptake protein [Dehalococcoidales bacterium]